MRPGTVVRFNERCVWPKRIGCIGVIVDTRGAEGRYPVHGLGRHEVIVYIPDDPLRSMQTLLGCKLQNGEPWSCATDRKSLDVVKETGL